VRRHLKFLLGIYYMFEFCLEYAYIFHAFHALILTLLLASLTICYDGLLRRDFPTFLYSSRLPSSFDRSSWREFSTFLNSSRLPSSLHRSSWRDFPTFLYSSRLPSSILSSSWREFPTLLYSSRLPSSSHQRNQRNPPINAIYFRHR